MDGEKSNKKDGTTGKVPSPKCKGCKNSLALLHLLPREHAGTDS